MKAAVVRDFASGPVFDEFPPAHPTRDTEMVVDVLAAGLHPRVRSQADGSHYTSTGTLPLVPGVDGVGRGPDGLLRYFVLGETGLGSMAAQTMIDVRRSVVLPDDADPVVVAAAMNPVMSSWLALHRRIRVEEGQTVLVLGATGNAGSMAVQVARLFGAAEVIAAGRDAERLSELTARGAHTVVSLAGGIDEAAERVAMAASGVDVVLDYVWGAPTVATMAAIVTRRADRGTPLTWIEIGSVAGHAAAIPSAALRAARLSIVGSGQGSVPTGDIVAELPAIAEAITAGLFEVDARAVPLAEVQQVWAHPERSGERVVFVP